MDQSTTVLFGLPGVRVDRLSTDDVGLRLVEFYTDDERAAACLRCGVVLTSVKGHAVTRPRDISFGERSIRCSGTKPDGDAGETTANADHSPSAYELPPRARLTGRLGRAMGWAIGDAARSVSEVAGNHGVSWPTAHRRFAALAEPGPMRVLGIDETRRGKPRWDRCETTGKYVRQDPWDTGFVDISGRQGMLGQQSSRTSATVVGWLRARSEEFRVRIEYVAVYASAVRTPDLLPNAVLVVDHFHLVAKANDAVTKFRQ